MIEVRGGYILDTEKSTELYTLKNFKFGNGSIYRTENGRYFSTSIDGDEPDSITYIGTDILNVEEIVDEWKDLNGEVEVITHFKEFEIG